MRVRTVLIAIAMAALVRAASGANPRALPRFEDLPVEEVFDQTPAPVVLAAARARQFRTALGVKYNAKSIAMFCEMVRFGSRATTYPCFVPSRAMMPGDRFGKAKRPPSSEMAKAPASGPLVTRRRAPDKKRTVPASRTNPLNVNLVGVGGWITKSRIDPVTL